ncbi:polysaccharide deacetylase family protein [Cohnella sp. REN36]|uniref:polysaccharide deacetylase family protein n=1 Tax=Cohnella sp. REN36 TaxID=2887347 RepID=UPI001D141C5B|nr:polysaccharide deacetylase family protein [Cohnella sp. REN36]MCC3375158.1 polysaccharide deacetylase family protein [Cohnella sp. REN36]
MQKKHGIGVVVLFCIIVGIVLFNLRTPAKAGPGPISVSWKGKIYEVPAAARIDGDLMVPLSFLNRAFKEDAPPKAESSAPPEVRHYTDRVAVLMYHHLMVKSNRNDIISADQFDGQMKLLKDNGYHVIGLDAYRDFMLNGKPVPDNAVLITFDDGYESFYDIAFPILKKYGFPAVNFIIVSGVDDHAKPGIPKLHWEQMREMKRSGMSFMSHTYDMHGMGVVNEKGGKKPLTVGRLYMKKEARKETAEEYRQRVTADLALAEKRLREELGNTYGALAFPYGKYNADLLEIVKELGIDLTFTTESGIDTPLNRKAYRINGGRSDKTPDDFLNALYAYGNSEIDGRDPRSVLTVQGKTITFPKVIMSDQGDGPLVSLQSFCEQFDLKMHWDKRKKRATLSEA